MLSETSMMAKLGQLAGTGMTFCSSWKLVTIGLLVSNNIKHKTRVEE